jgi:hypothetical protein
MNKSIINLIAIFAFIFFAEFVSAQDTLHFTNSQKIVVRVIEVGPKEVKYVRYTSQDGPVYTIGKSTLTKIVYSDGTVEYYNMSGKQVSPLAEAPFRRWGFTLHTTDLPLGLFSFETEYAFNKNFSLRIPLSIGLNSLYGNRNYNYGQGRNYYNKEKVFSTGFKLLYSPGGSNKRFNYYTGLSAEFGFVNNNVWWFYPSYFPMESTSFYGGLGIVNGLQFNATNRLTLGVEATLGAQISSTGYGYSPMGRASFTMTWRFGKVK